MPTDDPIDPGECIAPAAEPRYFWSTWFKTESLFELYTLFVLLSVGDLLATLKLMSYGVREGNWLANWVLLHYHQPGFVLYKLALVGFLLCVVRVIWQQRPSTARTLLWAANLLMTVIILMHLTIMMGLMPHR